MYRTTCFLTLLALALGTLPTQAQEPPPEKQAQPPGKPQQPALVVKDTGKAITIRDRSKEIRHVLSLLADFPQEVRDAVPCVAQSPDLPGKVLDLVKRQDTEYLNKILTNYPEDVRRAFRVLIPHPKAVEIMALHTNLMRVLGEIYKQEGLRAMKKIAEESKSGNVDATTATWAQRLDRNPEALRQYFEAVTDYGKLHGKEESYLGAGLIFDKKEALITMYALPPAGLATHVLVNADLYPELGNEMVEYWLHTESATIFDAVLTDGIGVYRRFYTEEFFRPEGRAARLRATAQLGKRLGGTEFVKGDFAALTKVNDFKVEAARVDVLAKVVDLKAVAVASSDDKFIKPRVPRKVDEVIVANKTVRPAAVATGPLPTYRYYWVGYTYQPYWWNYPVYYQAYWSYVYKPPTVVAEVEPGTKDLSTMKEYEKPAVKVKSPGYEHVRVWYSYSTPWWSTVPYGWPYGPIKPWWWWRIYYPGYYPNYVWYPPFYVVP
jgi:hypothetical protein